MLVFSPDAIRLQAEVLLGVEGQKGDAGECRFPSIDC